MEHTDPVTDSIPLSVTDEDVQRKLERSLEKIRSRIETLSDRSEAPVERAPDPEPRNLGEYRKDLLRVVKKSWPSERREVVVVYDDDVGLGYEVPLGADQLGACSFCRRRQGLKWEIRMMAESFRRIGDKKLRVCLQCRRARIAERPGS